MWIPSLPVILLGLVLFLSFSYRITEILWSSVKATVVVLKSLGRAEQCLEPLDITSDQLGCAYTAMDKRLTAATGSWSR